MFLSFLYHFYSFPFHFLDHDKVIISTAGSGGVLAEPEQYIRDVPSSSIFRCKLCIPISQFSF